VNPHGEETREANRQQKRGEQGEVEKRSVNETFIRKERVPRHGQTKKDSVKDKKTLQRGKRKTGGKRDQNALLSQAPNFVMRGRGKGGKGASTFLLPGKGSLQRREKA